MTLLANVAVTVAGVVAVCVIAVVVLGLLTLLSLCSFALCFAGVFFIVGALTAAAIVDLCTSIWRGVTGGR